MFSRLTSCARAAVASVSMLLFAATASAATFTVNSAADTNDAVAGDGSCATAANVCTLRAAIQEANALASDDVINFDASLSGATITLVAANGDFPVNNNGAPIGSLTINGLGANHLTLDGGGANRLFEIYGATVTIRGLSMQNGNGSGSSGGAIYSDNSALTLDSVVIRNNSTGQGGGVFLQGTSGASRIINSTFTGNTASFIGGAIFVSNQQLFMANTTVSGNTSLGTGGGGGGGGGIAFSTANTLFIRNSTITGNSAPNGPAGGILIYRNGATGRLDIGNTVVAGNSAGVFPEIQCHNDPNGLISAGNNLVGDSAGDAETTDAAFTYQPTDILDTPPQLGALADNGGATPTHALLDGSPAINHGGNALAVDPFDNSALATDQRGAGFPRVANRTVDIGAYESQSCLPPPAGLLGWWPGDGNANDISGNNNNGTATGVTYTTGEVGQAFNYTADTQKVVIPDSATLRPQSLTVEGWAKLTGTPTAVQSYFGKPIGTVNSDSYAVWYQNGTLHGAICADGNGNCAVVNAPSFSLNVWHHVAFTFDDPGTGSTKTLRLYVDGAQVATATTALAVGYDASPAIIGADYDFIYGGDHIGYSWLGQIDEVSLYNRPLSADEIQAIFNAGTSGKCSPTPSTPVANPGDIIISEFRTRGPGGAKDEYVELYNTTGTALAVVGNGLFLNIAEQSNGAGSGFEVVPAGVVIPAHGHYLLTDNTGYSLSSYAAGDNDPFTVRAYDIPDNLGMQLTTVVNNQNVVLDAVGFTTVNDITRREGAGLAPVDTNVGAGSQFAFVRKTAASGRPQDTNDNAADFALVSTSGAVGATQATLGAPGPENLASHLNRGDSIKATQLAPCTSSSNAPNRARDANAYSDTVTPSAPDGGDPASNPYALGTLRLRRRFTNLTNATVTALRFRVVDITTSPAPSGTADVRLLTSQDESGLTNPCGATATRGLTLEQANAQPRGGGLNSAAASGYVTLNGLAPGASVDVSFLLGVAQGGSFRFFVIVEALPAPPTSSAAQPGSKPAASDAAPGKGAATGKRAPAFRQD